MTTNHCQINHCKQMVEFLSHIFGNVNRKEVIIGGSHINMTPAPIFAFSHLICALLVGLFKHSNVPQDWDHTNGLLLQANCFRGSTFSATYLPCSLPSQQVYHLWSLPSPRHRGHGSCFRQDLLQPEQPTTSVTVVR